MQRMWPPRVALVGTASDSPILQQSLFSRPAETAGSVRILRLSGNHISGRVHLMRLLRLSQRLNGAIVDISQSHPSVYFLLGCFHGSLSTQVRLICDMASEPHFDVRDYQIVRYQTATDLKEIVAMLLEGLMPYFAALGPFRSERNAQLGLAQLRETNDVLPINPVDEGKPIADLMQQQNSGLIFSSVPWGVQRLLAVDDVGRQGAERSGVVEWHAMRDGRLGFVAYLNEPDFEARWSSRDYIDMVMSPTFALGAFECPAFVPKGAVAKISDEDLPMGDESLRVLRVSLQRSPDPVLLFSISQGELFSVPLDE